MLTSIKNVMRCCIRLLYVTGGRKNDVIRWNWPTSLADATRQSEYSLPVHTTIPFSEFHCHVHLHLPEIAYQHTFTHVQHEICALVLYRASRCHDGPVDQKVCHVIPGNTTIYEFNPFEFGSWDPTTYGFVPLEYLRSNFSGGVLTGDEECVRGFDNAGYYSPIRSNWLI